MIQANPSKKTPRASGVSFSLYGKGVRRDMREALITQQQELFCQGIAKGMTSTDAYKNAGYKSKSDATAQAAASRLMTKPKIKARLKELADEVKSKAIMDIAEAQERLSAYARRTPQPNSAGDGEIRPCIETSIKAIEMLVRIQGGFVDKQQIEMSGSLPVLIRNDVVE